MDSSWPAEEFSAVSERTCRSSIGIGFTLVRTGDLNTAFRAALRTLAVSHATAFANRPVAAYETVMACTVAATSTSVAIESLFAVATVHSPSQVYFH